MLIWRAASHRNVVQFLGYQMIKEVPWLVSPWVDKKSLVDYMRAVQVSRAKKLKLVSPQLGLLGQQLLMN